MRAAVQAAIYNHSKDVVIYIRAMSYQPVVHTQTLMLFVPFLLIDVFCCFFLFSLFSPCIALMEDFRPY